MSNWIIFSIGATQHFYIYYSEDHMRTYRVDIDSIAAIEHLLACSSWQCIEFVTRFDIPPDYSYKAQLDAAVARLRKRYQK